MRLLHSKGGINRVQRQYQPPRGRRRRLYRAGGALSLLVGSAFVSMAVATSASAATLTVCHVGCAYTQIAPAIAAASNGDTISIGPGAYLGGFTIDENLTLNGAGAQRTIISGGGPVITVGSFTATLEPSVSITGVTITNGVTESSPISTAYVGEEGVIVYGGGIFIPPTEDFATGATLTVSNSVITDNTAAPTTSVDAGFSCGTHDCQFAEAGGAVSTTGAS